MGLFDFFSKKRRTEATPENKILLAMPMFNHGQTFSMELVVKHLKEFWDVSVSAIEGNSQSASFSIEGETVVLATMDIAIPKSDLEATAAYAYLWPAALEDLANHNSHMIVSVLSGNGNARERFSILTKVLASILATSDCIGIHHGLQSLLIPRGQYLESADELKSGNIPVDLWVYIGLRSHNVANSAYTYGLKEFGKPEMEFVDVSLSLEEMHAFLSNIVSYLIKNDVTFKSGETLGYTEEQKIKISKRPGKFNEGEVLRLDV